MNKPTLCVFLGVLFVSGCVTADGGGSQATYENSADVVSFSMSGGKRLECLSGPWTNVVWYDRGVLRDSEGNVMSVEASVQNAADYACRNYFAAAGIPARQKATISHSIASIEKML